MKPFKTVDSNDLAFFESVMPGRVFAGEDISPDYDHDEMTIYGSYRPEAVLHALKTEEISAVLKYCNERNIAVTPRGSGTGLCGGCVPKDGGVVLSTEKMKKVLEVDAKNMTATVEPGVLLMEFPKSLEGTGLFYPPDPGEKTATIGGNAIDQRRRHARGALRRDPGLRAGHGGGAGQRRRAPSGRQERENLQWLQPRIDLMVGSEGTLGFLTKLTVKLLTRHPRRTVSLLIPLPIWTRPSRRCRRCCAAGREPRPWSSWSGRSCLDAENYLGKQLSRHQRRRPICWCGWTATTLRRHCGPSDDVPDRSGPGPGRRGCADLADTQERRTSPSGRPAARFWRPSRAARKAWTNATWWFPGYRIAAFVKKSVEIGKEMQVRICSFGHAGDGNLHIYVCQDGVADEQWHETVEKVMERLYSEARLLSGEVSGEHGIGHAKRAFLEESLGLRAGGAHAGY